MVRLQNSSRYPWLKQVNALEEYIPPFYYRQLLKRYSFNGRSDLQIFSAFLRQKKYKKILELGCGNGRASRIATNIHPRARFTFSDLSERMLQAARLNVGGTKASFVVSDAVRFMESTRDQFDLIFSLWSFSHSVHQHLHHLGFARTKSLVSSVLRKMVLKNMVSGSEFFLIHFDSMSDEQRPLMRQWQRVYQGFSDIRQQSPSKRILDDVLIDLDNQNKILLSIQHLRGEPIRYKTQEVFLEIFMNFHLETYFNGTAHEVAILRDLKKQLAPYRRHTGEYIVTPGCYIYTFKKI